jgi:hypothetical protein
MIKIDSLNSISVNGNPPVDVVSAIVDNPKSRPEIMVELYGYEMHLRMSADHSWLQEQIADLKRKLSPDISSIVDALLSSGLKAWGAAAITAANDEDGVIDLVLQLQDVAREAPSWSQCDRVKQLFGTACHYSKIVPTPEQAAGMQAVLDQGGSTGQIGGQWLSFRQWMDGQVDPGVT